MNIIHEDEQDAVRILKEFVSESMRAPPASSKLAVKKVDLLYQRLVESREETKRLRDAIGRIDPPPPN